MMTFLKGLFLFINFIIILALLVIHFIIKDSSYDASMVFYALPLPIIIAIILGLSIFLGNKRRKYNVIIMGLLIIIWLGRSFKIHFSEDVKENDLEIVVWNASRDNDFEEAFLENETIPDVFVLVESKKNDINALKLKYPDYYFYKSFRDLYIFSKQPLIIEFDTTSSHNTTVVNFKTYSTNFYAIDVTGSTDVPRSWELKFVDSKITNFENTIVLGDFNLPYESILLKNIKTNFNQAFNKKGNGFRETWFWNIPLLSIDHIWVSKDLEILKTEKIGTFKSDHSMIKTYIKH